MNKPDFFSQIADTANRLMKEGPAIQQDIEEKLQALVQARLRKMDLVSREEFDAQVAVLNRTRAKLQDMEKQLAELSAQLDTPEPSSPDKP
ncbi:accessory factor UbiK family protein [Spongiibacter taiwanensis]|uniref:accessory factor UbiK family protein n=1 Tax=Spongiibacter taiwanensis TaxID=1748242 RepID=UPI002034FC82|nr:accessory factor UbiK family protein [Spongiibacter taiwanensis]USA44754.1 accessory factor UbiK family protein [Spongiibacter taiwanensis]